jgi:hypothetical protein
MSNPLIDKYNEIYGKKEIGIVSKSPITLSDPNIPLTTTPSVATSNTGITKASNLFATYADDLKTSFLQVAEQLQTGKAQIASINVDMNNHLSLKRITFEVMIYEP